MKVNKKTNFSCTIVMFSSDNNICTEQSSSLFKWGCL